MARKSRSRTRDTDAIREIASRIQSVDEVSPYVKVGAFGPNGSGKTRLAASGPKCLIVDIVEEGTRSAAGQGTGAKKIEVRTWAEIGHVYWLLKGLTDRNRCPFKTVALDTTTAMNKVALDLVIEEAEERDPTREKKTPSKRDYGRSGKLMDGMIIAYRNLPMHVIFLAQQRIIKDEDTGEVLEYAVDLPAGCRATLTGAVSVLGYMEQRTTKVRVKGKVKRQRIDTMRVAPEEEFPALKDRTYNLPDLVRRPTMPMIIEAWHKNTNNKED